MEVAFRYPESYVPRETTFNDLVIGFCFLLFEYLPRSRFLLHVARWLILSRWLILETVKYVKT
jgi:hypothetical protein